MLYENKIKELAKAIEESIKNQVRDLDIAIAFSGGVDSTTIAYIAKKYAKHITLYTVYSRDDADDLFYAKLLSKKLNLELKTFHLNKGQAEAIYKKLKEIYKLNYVKTEILVPLFYLLQHVKEDIIVFGAGSEELFMGYRRYYEWIKELSDEEVNKRLLEEYEKLDNGGDISYIKKIAELHGKKALFPFYNNKIKEIAFSFPVYIKAKDEEREKYILREAAKLLGVPIEAIMRKKRALQYGTGVHKDLIKLKRKGVID